MKAAPWFALSLLFAQAPPRPAIDAAAWLAGCWVQESATRRIDEQWMAPHGGAMLGMSRTVANGRVVEWEFLQIRQTDSGLAYVVKPSGQPEATFLLASAAEGELRFENAAHDFPQRIIYRRQPDATLLARIEGTRDGKQRAVDFQHAMRRQDCWGRPLIVPNVSR